MAKKVFGSKFEIEELRKYIQKGDKVKLILKGYSLDTTKRQAEGVVIRKYPHFVMLDMGNYRECFLYSTMVMVGNELEIRRAKEWKKD